MEYIFKALADTNRLNMIRLLIEHEEVCVCVFEETLGIKQANASKHLHKLKEMDIVEIRKDGKYIHYSLTDQFLSENGLLIEYIRNNREATPMTGGCSINV